MKLNKVSVSDRDIQRKYRTQTNCEVSYWRDEFDCDGHTSFINYKNKPRKSNIGTSKMDFAVSTGYLVNGLRGRVGG